MAIYNYIIDKIYYLAQSCINAINNLYNWAAEFPQWLKRTTTSEIALKKEHDHKMMIKQIQAAQKKSLAKEEQKQTLTKAQHPTNKSTNNPAPLITNLKHSQKKRSKAGSNNQGTIKSIPSNPNSPPKATVAQVIIGEYSLDSSEYQYNSYDLTMVPHASIFHIHYFKRGTNQSYLVEHTTKKGKQYEVIQGINDSQGQTYLITLSRLGVEDSYDSLELCATGTVIECIENEKGTSQLNQEWIKKQAGPLSTKYRDLITTKQQENISDRSLQH